MAACAPSAPAGPITLEMITAFPKGTIMSASADYYVDEINRRAKGELSQGLPAGFEVAAAKAFTGKNFHKITEDALRIHGALGSAQECDIQLYYRRATALELYLGDPHLHQEKIAQLMGI